MLFITTWYITILVMFLTFFLEHRLFLNSTASPLEWSIYAICVVYGIVFTLFLWYHCPLEWLLNPALSTQEQSVQDQQPTRPYQSPPNLYQSNPYQPNTSTALDNIIDYQNFNV